MPGPPRVQLSLKGRLLSEVAFAQPLLRIGRMRENDIVVNNLAVSRFHATLRQAGDGFVLEDLGGENGTQLNGERICGSVSLTPDDVVQLGKYELRIVLQPGLQIAGAPVKKASDAWDASQTYFAPAATSPAQSTAPAPIAASLPAAELLPDAPAATEAPDPDGVFAFGDEDLAASAEPAGDSSEMETDPLTAASPEHTALFDFGASSPIGAEPSAEMSRVAEPTAEAEAAAQLYAGLIVQRGGKLHALCAWESAELCAGRAPECEVVLADAGVSRRHALFSRVPSGFEVRDLGSVNGVYVNGQRTKQRVLAVGDVVRIESFELTFVLDHQPISSEVNGPTPALPEAGDNHRATQFSLEAPSFASDDEPIELMPLASESTDARRADESALFDDNTDGFEILPVSDDPLAASLPNSIMPPLPEADLLRDAGADEADEKEAGLEGVLVASAPAVAAMALAAGSATASAPLILKFALDASRLSPRARDALAVLAEEGLLLPALLSIQRGE